MTILAWIIIGTIAGAIIFLLLSVYFFGQTFFYSRKLKHLPKRPPKKKKKRKRWSTVTRLSRKKRNHSLMIGFVLFIFSIVLVSSARYASYYQSINLSSDDSVLIVRSYYLLRDFKEELAKAAVKEDEELASQQNIRYLATTLASYSTKKASTLNTEEGQAVLNRYYASLAELGINATRESRNFYGNSNLVNGFESDIDKIITYETAAFDYFKVNHSELEEESSASK
ncbi:hypothetical protein [Enterococcus sp. 5H]|uniref:hypothetical protein n=1 Tax=Enterococcus sp. 5H TaxID=1229490 RepID=UPI0023030A53|nr:hypothetical protein [Enterococcus sp. 5H]MDA9472547.1 hypothetical protein [Enterococcus sp. 5H]